MKSKIVTQYSCDFCSKKMLSKGPMSTHEKFCGSNPENFKACNGCKFIEEIKIPYEVEYDEYGSVTREATGFRCTKLDKKLYPLIAERKKLPQRFPNTFEGQEKMPKVCDQREAIYPQSDFDFLW